MALSQTPPTGDSLYLASVPYAGGSMGHLVIHWKARGRYSGIWEPGALICFLLYS